MYKIDILKMTDTLVSQNLETQEQRYFTISDLDGEKLKTYNNFIILVNNKLTINYNQIYVAKEPVIRFVGLVVDGVESNNFNEVIYDDLYDEEKIIYDNFYNNFIN